MITDNKAITGEELEAFIDRLEADLEESGKPEQIDLIARMRSQTMMADSIRSIARVCSLWLSAGGVAEAWATLNTDGEALVNAAAPDEKTSLSMQLAIFRMQIASTLNDEAASLLALESMKVLVPQLGAELARYRNLEWLDPLEQRGLKLALATIELRKIFQDATLGRETNRIWDLADFHERRASAFKRAQNTAQAVAEANAALEALKSAQTSQEISEEDWLIFGDSLIELIPDALPS